VSGGPTLQGQERLSLARELHDTVLQAFILVVMQLRSAIEGEEGLRRETQLATGLSAAEEGLACARSLLAELRGVQPNRPSRQDDRGCLRQGIERVLRDVFRHAPHVLILRGSHNVMVPLGIRSPILKIVREASTNIVRHAHAQHVDCRIETKDGTLSICITDDGIGLKGAASADRYGIIGMLERAQLLGGSLEINPAAGRGTSLIVRVPLRGRVEPSRGSPTCSNSRLRRRAAAKTIAQGAQP
jgi:signal transduction histidine kinase